MMGDIMGDLYLLMNFVFVCSAVLEASAMWVVAIAAASHHGWHDRRRAVVAHSKMTHGADVYLHDVRCAPAQCPRLQWLPRCCGVRWLISEEDGATEACGARAQVLARRMDTAVALRADAFSHSSRVLGALPLHHVTPYSWFVRGERGSTPVLA